jgi:hypothetical protein
MRVMKSNVTSSKSKRTIRVAPKNTNAMSEIISTILLLSISLSLLCVVYILVMNNATSPSTTTHISTSNIIASADETNVILQNNGGGPLSFNTKLVITIGGQDFIISAKDYIIDTNGDGEWSIGEQITFDPLTIDSLYGLEVIIKVINPDANSMIMAGLVQEGARGDEPYVQSLNPYNVWPHSATMKAYYNFVKPGFLPGKFWFQWKRVDYPQWNSTTVINITALLSGYQETTLYNLTANKNYLYESWMQYTSGNATINISGGIKLFTTKIDAMGIWHFDEASGITLFDSSGQFPPNDGILKPTEIRGPQRVAPQLNYSVKSLSFDGIDDYGQVSNSDTISVTEECTIEAWVNRSDHCDGLIGKPLASSLTQFGNYTIGCYDPYLIHVTGTIYALVTTNENSYGILSTVNITDAGEIIENPSTSSYYIDFFTFETSCKTPKLVQVNESNGIYAIVYPRPSSGNRLYLKTVQIFPNGFINTTAINTRILDANLSTYPDILSIGNSVYAIVCGITSANNGVLLSVNISDTGVISPVNKKLNMGDIMQEPEIVKVVKSVDIYVIVYNCIGDDGGLRTVRITSTGAVSDISGHVYFDDDDGGNPEIISIDKDIYAIVYAGPILRQTGMLKTIEIAADGTITLSRTIPPLAKTISQLTFETTVGNSIRYPHIFYTGIAMPYYGISYSIDSPTASLQGKITTLLILNTGMIVNLTKKDCIVEPFQCSSIYVLPIHLGVFGIYAVVYRSDSGDGVIKTIRIKNLGLVDKDPILNMEEVGGLKCYAEDEILTSDGRYIIDVYRGINAIMMVRTIEAFPGNKTIAHCFTDSLTLELGYTSSNGTYNASYEPSIIWINNDVYAIAYCHYMTVPMFHHGKIATIRVNATGHISLIKRYTFDTDVMNTPFSFTQINKINGVYAIAFQMYSTSQGKIATIKIDNTGNTIGLADSYIFENLRCREPYVTQVNGDIYTIIYRDSTTSSAYGRLATLQIFGNNGTIKKSLIDLWSFANSCYHPCIIKVASNVFASVYSQYYSSISRYITRLATVTIADDGIITKSVIDSIEYARRYYTNNYLVHHPDIIHVNERIYAIISKDNPDPWNTFQYTGLITTLRIGENGDIIDTVDGSIKISSSPRVNSYDFKIVPFVEDYYIAVYGGVNNDLYQCVIRIPINETTQTIFSKKDSYVIQANKTMVFVTFTDSNNQQYTLSTDLQNNWNYIVSTYDKTTMYLYLNTNLVGSLPLNNKPLKVTANNLYFGLYNACYDEFSLYAAILTPAKILQNYNYYRPS